MEKNESSDVKKAAAEAILWLEEMANPVNKAGMARYGINTEHALGVSVKQIRQMAKTWGEDTLLALELMRSPYHEAHLLAAIVVCPEELTGEQMDAIVSTFDSWDTCDVFCGEFAYHPQAFRKALQWVKDEREFVRRAGFSLFARMSVRRKKMPDEAFQAVLSLLEHYSGDPRPMVNKAIDWALRQIGKRSTFLHPYALSLAEKMAGSENKHTRRAGRVAARELRDPKVIARLKPHTVWPEEGVVDVPGYC